MRIDGQCHCGLITYDAEIDPEKVMICHCTDCQTLTGSAFRAFAITKEGGFHLLSGEVKVYVKTAESGAKRHQGFCPVCGSPIYSTSDASGPKVYAIRTGTARQRNELIPRAQIWCRSEQAWTNHLGSIPKTETQDALTAVLQPTSSR